MKTYTCTITFTTDLLGTAPTDPEVYNKYIAQKAIENGVAVDIPHEAASLPDRYTVAEDMRTGITGFHRTPDGKNALYDYMLKGFLKEACGHMRRDKTSRSAKLKAYKKVIDGQVFPQPRLIPITLAGPVTLLQRPLRAATPQGDRVALTSSQSIPAGSSMTFDLVILADSIVPRALLTEWLDYGQFIGLGQWRSGGHGRFTYRLEEKA